MNVVDPRELGDALCICPVDVCHGDEFCAFRRPDRENMLVSYPTASNNSYSNL
jgi:hypothetical protein